MQHGLDCSGLGSFADAAVVADLAARAEEAGWDGLFLWEHLAWTWGPDSGDPWISLAAAAARTTRIRLGTNVTPLPRRRPQVVATSVTSLDRLSGGRATLGVGLGGTDAEFDQFGEDPDPRRRARLLDEGLALLDDLLTGRRPFGPRPVQAPRPPIWVGGTSPAALRRATRWDGWTAESCDAAGNQTIDPDGVAAAIAEHGLTGDVVVEGWSDPGDRSLRQRYEAAGATWWLEAIHERRAPLSRLLERVDAGP